MQVQSAYRYREDPGYIRGRGDKMEADDRHLARLKTKGRVIIPHDVKLELCVVRKSYNYRTWPSHVKKMLTQAINYLDEGHIHLAANKLAAIDWDMKPRNKAKIELSIERLEELI